MRGEFDLYGVFVPTLALWMVAAFLLSVPVRRVFAATGFYRLVWHRPLFDLALYVLLLGGVIVLAHRILS